MELKPERGMVVDRLQPLPPILHPSLKPHPFQCRFKLLVQRWSQFHHCLNVGRPCNFVLQIKYRINNCCIIYAVFYNLFMMCL